jgi:iron-sulfur cluster repair protein YtfE (RIC family)
MELDDAQLHDTVDLREHARPDVVRGIELDAAQRGPGEHLRQVHDMYRAELQVVTELAALVRAGEATLDDLRGTIHGMAVRTNIEQFGAICLRYCAMVTNHHTLEDRAIFPAVRAEGEAYAALIDQLEHEHGAIHQQLRRVDDALVRVDTDRDHVPRALEELDALDRILRSHFAYEETQLFEPLGLVGFGH